MPLRVFVAGLCFAGTALLLGCASPVDIATEARESALAEKDVYDGYLLLAEAAENRPFWYGITQTDDQYEWWKIMEQTADALVLQAAEQGNEKLLLITIGDTKQFSLAVRPSSEVKTRVTQLLLEQLEEEEESSFSPEMLVLLSEQVRQGEYAVQNYKLAVRIAELAWQRGYAEAARQLTRIYNSANDAENAYFWGLRCIGECRGYQHRNHMEDIARDFSAEDIQRIQAAATDSSNLRVTF